MNSITNSARASPSTTGCASTCSGSGSWTIPSRWNSPAAATVAYRLSPDANEVPSAKPRVSSGDMRESYYSSQSIVTPPTAVVTSMSRCRGA
jgi:hypothetical protein